MRQHILRLLIVLILALGIGFVIYYFVQDNSNFNISSFAEEEFNKYSQTYTLIDTLKDDIGLEFTEDKVIYDSLKESFDYYSHFLFNNVSKNERDNIIYAFKNFNEKYDDLTFSLNSVKSYLNETNLNETELQGRKNRAKEDFDALNLSFYEINFKLENIILDKVFDGKYLDASFSLISCKNLLCKMYLTHENNSQQHFVNSVINKVTNLKGNGFQVSDDSIIFAIKYNENSNEINNLFNYYFEHNEPTGVLSELLEELNKEVYYAQV